MPFFIFFCLSNLFLPIQSAASKEQTKQEYIFHVEDMQVINNSLSESCVKSHCNEVIDHAPYQKELCERNALVQQPEQTTLMILLGDLKNNEKEFKRKFQDLSPEQKLVFSKQIFLLQATHIKAKILAFLLSHIENFDGSLQKHLKVVLERDFLHQIIKFYPADDEKLKVVTNVYLEKFSPFTVDQHGHTLLDSAIKHEKENLCSLICEKMIEYPKRSLIIQALIITFLYDHTDDAFESKSKTLRIKANNLLVKTLSSDTQDLPRQIAYFLKEGKMTSSKLEAIFKIYLNHYHYNKEFCALLHGVIPPSLSPPLPPLEAFIDLLKRVNHLEKKGEIFREVMSEGSYATKKYNEIFTLASAEPSANLNTLISLFDATKSCPVNVMQFFLNKDGKINLNCATTFSHKHMQIGRAATILNYALEQKNVDAIKFLVSQKIRPSSFDTGEGEEDALHYFIKRYINFLSQDSLEKIELMLKGGINPNEKVEVDGSALYWTLEKAYELQKYDAVSPLIKMLLAYDANPCEQVHGKSLIELARDRNMKEAALILEKAQEYKTLPLHFAATFEGTTVDEVVDKLEYLIEAYKYDPHQKDVNGKTALECANERGIDAISFFKQQGVDLNEKNRAGETLLIKYIKNSYSKDIIESLIRCGASVTEKDTLGRTALHWCALMGKTEEAKKMVEAHPSIDFINEKDNDGNTALHYACGQENTVLSLYLLENGANLFSKNHENKIPIELTASYKLRETIIRNFEYRPEIKELFSEVLYNRMRVVFDLESTPLLKHDFYFGNVQELCKYIIFQKSQEEIDQLSISNKIFRSFLVQNNFCAASIFLSLINETSDISSLFEIQDEKRRTILQQAVEEGKLNFVSLFLSNQKIRSLAENQNLFHHAVHNRYSSRLNQIVNLLVYLGLDSKRPDAEGNTFLEYAAKNLKKIEAPQFLSMQTSSSFVHKTETKNSSEKAFFPENIVTQDPSFLKKDTKRKNSSEKAFCPEDIVTEDPSLLKKDTKRKKSFENDFSSQNVEMPQASLHRGILPDFLPFNTQSSISKYTSISEKFSRSFLKK